MLTVPTAIIVDKGIAAFPAHTGILINFSHDTFFKVLPHDWLIPSLNWMWSFTHLKGRPAVKFIITSVTTVMPLHNPFITNENSHIREKKTADFFLCPLCITTVRQLALCLQCGEDILCCDMRNILWMKPPDLGLIYWEKEEFQTCGIQPQ